VTIPKWLRALTPTIRVMQVQEPAEKPADTPAEKPAVTAVQGRLAIQAEGFQKIRDSLRAYAAALGAIGTALVSGFGYAAFSTMMPVPDDRLLWVAVGLVLSCVFATSWLVANFYRPTRRIAFNASLLSPHTSPEEDRDTLDERERKGVIALFAQAPKPANVPDLANLEKKAGQMEDAASTESNAEKRQRKLDEARYLMDRYDEIAGSAALWVLEDRASRALSWPRLVLAPMIAGVSLVLLFGLAYYSAGERARIDLVAKCKDSRSDPACARYVPTLSATASGASETTAAAASADTARVDVAAQCMSAGRAAGYPTDPLAVQAVAACAGLTFPGPTPAVAPASKTTTGP